MRGWLGVLAGLAVVAGGGVAYWKLGQPAARTLAALPAASVGAPVGDPLNPGPLKLREVALAGGEAWVSARPAGELLKELKPAARGGVDPCDTPDPGWGDYLPGKMHSGAYVMMPKDPAPAGTFDVVMHFHGHELALKEFLRAKTKFLFMGMTWSRYADRLSGEQALDELVALIEQQASERAGKPARVRKLVIAAWSGGYAAINLVLDRSARKPDAVILLDGLHGSRDQEVLKKQLDPIVRYAKRATKDEVFMYVSHSSIDTDGYASATEGVHFLIHALGGRPTSVERVDPFGMRLVELYSAGGFHARGYAGGGKSDHCAQLTLYPIPLHALERRWR
jgi:hypothetical protein